MLALARRDCAAASAAREGVAMLGGSFSLSKDRPKLTDIILREREGGRR
jgi:hypothetical protein